MKTHNNGNTENQKVLRSEITFLDLVKTCWTKHQFSARVEIKACDIREVDITLGKTCYNLNIRYLVFRSC